MKAQSVKVGHRLTVEGIGGDWRCMQANDD